MVISLSMSSLAATFAIYLAVIRKATASVVVMIIVFSVMDGVLVSLHLYVAVVLVY